MKTIVMIVALLFVGAAHAQFNVGGTLYSKVPIPLDQGGIKAFLVFLPGTPLKIVEMRGMDMVLEAPKGTKVAMMAVSEDVKVTVDRTNLTVTPLTEDEIKLVVQQRLQVLPAEIEAQKAVCIKAGKAAGRKQGMMRPGSKVATDLKESQDKLSELCYEQNQLARVASKY